MAAQRVSSGWRKLPLSLTELCIDTTLRCGQSFRWQNINNEWHCVLQGRIISLKQDHSYLHYRALWPSVPLNSTSPTPVHSDDHDDDGTASLLHSYFALSHSLATLYKQWAASDPNFARRAPAFTGIRILDQDAWETLIAFICSSNNNISRISQMVHKLCIHYGPYIGTLHGQAFHDFPSPEALAGTRVEAHLRELGFGYRAKYIAETARIVSTEKPSDWLRGLRNPKFPAPDDALGVKKEQVDDEKKPITYKAAHEALMELSGVGPKVADCVCLMGLGWGDVVPVDTHVWQIAQRDYRLGKGGSGKTLSKAMYDAVGDYFRQLWGPHAGWAQSVLFTANLKSFAGQASGGKTESPGPKAAVVKVQEESKETVIAGSVARTKKRKAVMAVVATKLEGEDEGTKNEVTQSTTFVLRRSKRRKA